MKTAIVNFHKIYKNYKNIIQLYFIWFFILSFIAVQVEIRLPNSIYGFASNQAFEGSRVFFRVWTG